MEQVFVTARPTDAALAAQWLIHNRPRGVIGVIDADQRFVGMIRWADLKGSQGPTVADMMVPAATVPTLDPDADMDQLERLWPQYPDWPALPVVAHDRLVGVVRPDVSPPVSPPAATQPWSTIPADVLQRHLINAMASGLLIVDAHGIVRVLNPYGASLLGVAPEEVLNHPYDDLAPALFPHMVDYLRGSAIPRILAGHEALQGERQFQIQNGRHLLFKFGTVRQDDQLVAILVTFMDVTPLKEAEARAQAQAQELEMAFGLTLPNSKVITKLQASPEYQDTYNPDTGVATVTAVIPEGTYRHVINGLRVMAELHALGVFQLVGLDKDTLVQAFIFHDIGKEQPILQVGTPFIPAETFEPGHLHAERSADWAAKYYRVSSDVEWLIRMHHTAESDLPPAFPAALKPMWRLIRLVDGLSAGITRRRAQLDPLVLEGSTLLIHERNQDARYHRHYRVAIYSGVETPL